MRITAIVLGSVIAGLAAPASAQTPAPATAPAAQPPAAASSELICRRVEETGSLVKKKKKQCYTREQWDRLATMSRDAMGQGQMSGSSSGQ